MLRFLMDFKKGMTSINFYNKINDKNTRFGFEKKTGNVHPHRVVYDKTADDAL